MLTTSRTKLDDGRVPGTALVPNQPLPMAKDFT